MFVVCPFFCLKFKGSNFSCDPAAHFWEGSKLDAAKRIFRGNNT